jgi:hypothetical protein
MRVYNRVGQQPGFISNFADMSNAIIRTETHTADFIRFGDKYYKIIVKDFEGSLQLDIEESVPYNSVNEIYNYTFGSDGNRYIKYNGNWFLIMIKSVDGALQLDIDEENPLSSVP